MNFFGHFVVARALGHDEDACLGAMLPDLLPMCGAELEAPSPALRAGIALHHRTDAVFHSAADFTQLNAAGRRALIAGGLRRGPALAVAHVGVELLLDGWLARSRDEGPAFQRSLLPRPSLRWHGPDDAHRFERLGQRLVSIDVPRRYADPSAVTEALHRMLAPRPRLALRQTELPGVEAWLRDVQPQVDASGPRLLGELKRSLAESQTDSEG